jgi:uncharacterized protein (TIGR02231 family)
MKKSVFSLLLAVALIAPLRAENEKEIKAPIDHVTVYPDRAQITHEASFDIAPGKTILKLTGLSPYIDAQSIQVKGIGEFTVMSVNLQNNYLQNLDDQPEVKSIRSQIEILQSKIEDERTAINTLEEKRAFLNANESVLAKATTFSLDQFKALMDVYTTNIDQIASARLKKTRLIKDYEKQLAALQQQISDKTSRQKLPSGEISVTVTAEKAGSGKMTFTYVVGNAGWYPSYDIRVNDISKPVEIFYKANVYQSSGVEWKNVKLSFSNASPWIAGDVPVLNTWFLDFYQPVTMVNYKSAAIRSEAPEAMAEMKADSRDKSFKKEMAAPPVVVEKKTGEMSVTFDVTVPNTILSDGKIQTIEIQHSSTPATYKYVTVPKSSQLAYLTGNIIDWAKQSLMSGEATLYFENTFVGRSMLNVNQLSDTLTISLGTDPGLLVKREKRKDFTSKKIIGSNKTDTYSFLITVRNNKTTPVQITVNDQIPVSSNSSITIEANELSGGKLSNDTGLIKWDIELKPQEKKELVLTYSVKYPKNQTVILE